MKLRKKLQKQLQKQRQPNDFRLSSPLAGTAGLGILLACFIVVLATDEVAHADLGQRSDEASFQAELSAEKQRVKDFYGHLKREQAYQAEIDAAAPKERRTEQKYAEEQEAARERYVHYQETHPPQAENKTLERRDDAEKAREDEEMEQFRKRYVKIHERLDAALRNANTIPPEQEYGLDPNIDPKTIAPASTAGGGGGPAGNSGPGI